MYIEVLKSKIHRVTVTEANLNYLGSITIDEDLMDAADLMENEKVQVVNVNNGERLETYVITGVRGSGTICLNGPAARNASSSRVWRYSETARAPKDSNRAASNGQKNRSRRGR